MPSLEEVLGILIRRYGKKARLLIINLACLILVNLFRSNQLIDVCGNIIFVGLFLLILFWKGEKTDGG